MRGGGLLDVDKRIINIININFAIVYKGWRGNPYLFSNPVNIMTNPVILRTNPGKPMKLQLYLRQIQYVKNQSSHIQHKSSHI